MNFLEEKIQSDGVVKPGNILIDDDGKYMITDFDISTRQSGTQRMTARQVQEMQDFNYGCGTPDYMGPERWPDKDVNYRPPLRPSQASDIWSLGATLYELMEGHVPFGETGGAYQRNLCKDLSPSNRKRNAVPKITGNYSKELRKLSGYERRRTAHRECNPLLREAQRTQPKIRKRKITSAVESFETVTTKLQMGGRMLIADFEYSHDRQGRRYGWSVARYSTPEDFFGEERLLCRRSPKDSYDYLLCHLMKLLPQATSPQLIKLLG